MRLFDSLTLQRLIGSLGHRRRDAKDLQRKTYQSARTDAVTLIQRFGRSDAPAALNLNIHFHMLILDGVYVDRLNGSARFHWVSSPTTEPSVGVRNWPKFAAYFLVTGVRLGHI
jgi:hypothetical protein